MRSSMFEYMNILYRLLSKVDLPEPQMCYTCTALR